MTADDFRKLALELPEAVEGEHMNHPDFRIGGKIFATLGPDEEWGMVSLAPEKQESYVHEELSIFVPFNGAWGKGGATKVILEEADEFIVREALTAAWRNRAPKKIAKKYEDELD